MSHREDDGEMIDKGDAENSNPDEEMIIQMKSQGKSRLALLRTEKPGRPRKVY